MQLTPTRVMPRRRAAGGRNPRPTRTTDEGRVKMPYVLICSDTHKKKKQANQRPFGGFWRPVVWLIRRQIADGALRKVPPKLAAGAHPPVMLRCNLLIPHVRHPRVACREGAICSSFLSASIQGGAAEPGAVATQFPAAAPAVKGAGYTPDRRGYTPAPPGGL